MTNHEIENLKKKEMLVQLKKVKKNDWGKMKEGTLLFHSMSNSINAFDKFLAYNSENNFVTYLNIEGKMYSLLGEGWYFFDIDLLDAITEKYNLRLFRYKDVLFISSDAFLVETATSKLNLIKKEVELSIKNEELIAVDEIDGYDIILR